MVDLVSIKKENIFCTCKSHVSGNIDLKVGAIGLWTKSIDLHKDKQVRSLHEDWQKSLTLTWGSDPAPGNHFISWVPLTYTAWDGVIPLGQCIRHRLAADGSGTLEQVTWVTLKSNYGTCRELRTNPPPISGLWDRAALCVTGAWNSWGRSRQIATVSSRVYQEWTQRWWE